MSKQVEVKGDGVVTPHNSNYSKNLLWSHAKQYVDLKSTYIHVPLEEIKFKKWNNERQIKVYNI